MSIFWTRVCIDVWDSFIRLLVLAATSANRGTSNNAADVSKNASAGLERYRTMATEVRIRAYSTLGAHNTREEDVRILFGDQKPTSDQELQVGKGYG